MGSKQRTLVIGGALVVVAVIVAAVMVLVGRNSTQGTGDGGSSGLTVVRGVVGSEKEELFNDPQAQEIFKKHGLDVQVTTSGSWAMADKEGLTDNDFASPSSELAGQHIKDVHGNKVIAMTKPFYSPIAVATSDKVLDVLSKNGVASQDAGGVWRIDMAKYLDLVKQGKRWTDLQGSDEYPSSRTVMMTSTDVRSSNSALMYLALSSYVMNGNAPVTSEDAGRKQVDDLLGSLFLDQGYSQSSSAGPWESYLSKGAMNQPLTVIYESQFIEAQNLNPSRIVDGMRIAYPSPTILTDHVFVSFSENGKKVQDILDTDPDMAKVIASHGFRLNGQNSGVSDQLMKDKGWTGYASSDMFIDTAQAPSYEVLDAMLEDIKQRY